MPRPADSDLRALFIGAARDILREPDTPLDLRKVAERAGKSRTAPYLVFGKESDGGGLLALRIAVAADGAREMAERMRAAEREGDAPMDALRHVVRAFLAFVEENTRLFRLMYGSDINALPTVGPEAFLTHPEFRRLLEWRNDAGVLVEDIIARAQAQGLLVPDAAAWRSFGEAVDDADDADDDTPPAPPRQRYLLIAWSAMIGAALLRDDDLLRAIGWIISRDEAADLVVESVFGLDPQRTGRALQSFLRTASVRAARDDARAEHGETMIGALHEAPPIASDPLTAFPGLLRASRALPLVPDLRVLWIDDHPEWVADEVATLRQLGARVVQVRSTTEAVRALRDARDWRLVISDIRRGRDANAGVAALPVLHDAAPDVPVVFFVAEYDASRGVPAGAAGITNRTDELLHLIVDVVEGRRGGR